MWHVMCGTFDDANGMNQFLIQLKKKFGIDFQDFKKCFFFLFNFKQSLRQIRKKVFKKMIAACGVTLQKSSGEYKNENKTIMLEERRGSIKIYSKKSSVEIPAETNIISL